MNPIEFSNIELNFGEKMTLHLLPIIKSNRFFNSQTLIYLHKLGLLDRIGGVYSVNRFGKMYFRIKRKERLKFMIPTVISIVALFAGYDVYKFPLLGEALSAVKMLLIHVMGSLGILP
nr:MAG TPA: hypothetical protein [Bacteriophage sp.]